MKSRGVRSCVHGQPMGGRDWMVRIVERSARDAVSAESGAIMGIVGVGVGDCFWFR